jgi:hypothetical protein
VVLSDLREAIGLRVLGRGRWTGAFEPAWVEEDMFKTGLLM